MTSDHAASQSILILSGTGRYADPWHPYAETSEAAAALLGALDRVEVRIRNDIDAALADLDGIDLLVVNAGDPTRNTDENERPDDRALAAAQAGAEAFLAGGGALLVLHSGTSSLADAPALVDAMPARWVPGRSWHPDFGPVSLPIEQGADGHPIVAGIDRVEADDELYSDLVVAPGADVLLSHEIDGVRHPLVLARESAGRSGTVEGRGIAARSETVEGGGIAGRGADAGRTRRTVVDALGHDARSYMSPSHRLLLRQAAEWLLGRR